MHNWALQLNYSLVNAGVTWVLDEFELALQEGANNRSPLSSLDLPTQSQWESTQWRVRAGKAG